MDWVVTIIGVIGFYLAGQKVWWAWYVNIANQVLWTIFAVVTEQWGFLIGIPLYMSVFIKNAHDWTKEHRQKQKIVAGLREPIGKITLLENRPEGLFAQGVLFKSGSKRPQHGPCPGCKAPENKWCYEDCALLDPMDYR